MQTLKNTRHERFCQLVAAGGEKTEAFCQVYPRARNWKPKCRWNRSSAMAAKLADRIRELQAVSARETIATRTEIAEFLTRIIRTPIAQLDVASPLAQEQDAKAGRFKMPSKLEAADKLAKLMGYYEQEKPEQTFHFKPDAAVFEALASR